MSRTVNVNEEFVVVSEGKKDTGKFAALGNDGKFDPSVIPVIENLQEQIDKLKGANGSYDVLWSGSVGTSTDTAVKNTIALSKSLEDYNKIGVSFYATDGSFVWSQYREFLVDQLTAMINSTNNKYYLSCVVGYSNYIECSAIYKGSTYTSLIIGSSKSFVTEIRGIY